MDEFRDDNHSYIYRRKEAAAIHLSFYLKKDSGESTKEINCLTENPICGKMRDLPGLNKFSKESLSLIKKINRLKLNKIIQTSDGSHTIYVPELDEHYHSIHGAVQESSHIFIKTGFDTCNADPVSILEIGFGTGLNVLLTAIRSLSDEREIFFTSIEKYPLDEITIKTLNHFEFAGKEGREIFNLIHSSPWNQISTIIRNFHLKKLKMDFTVEKPEGLFDLIYFDAFGPDKQPEMWTSRIFESLSHLTVKNGIFVTYSAKGAVKRSLKSCGFDVALLPGPPGKRQMIRAVKI